MVLFLLILSKSLPNKRIIKPIGVTTIKNTTPMIRGEIIDPNIVPNLNHNLFKGVKDLEFKAPKTKKTKDKIKAHNLKSPWDFKGHNDIIKKTKKNKNPKLLFDEILIGVFFISHDLTLQYLYCKI
tara:strand:- start:335 stop:712 length:378 start_codon:yes stop_codon:yes gene_type:complete